MRILVLGGYGVFGGRLVDLLGDVPGLEILVSGRNAAKGEQFCTRVTGATTLQPFVLDRRDVAGALAGLAPDLIVDATGPFQAYGEDPYAVVRTAIATGTHYLDFADGSDFVFGIDQFDAEAKAAGLFVLSGVSSFPVLTAAVVQELGKGMTVRRITGGIAPSPHAGIGLNVMRAVVGYAGSPVALRRGGRDTIGVGLAEAMRYTIAVPGRIPLRSLRFSLVDVPDLRVIPAAMPELRDIWMGAGPVPEVLHRALNLLARARHRFGLPPLTPFSRVVYRVVNLLTFGDHRGGMFVEVTGEAEDKPVTRSWHLLAEGDDGPLIPSMAIEGLVRKAMAGDLPEPGARAAIGALDLADYDALFAGRRIYTGIRQQVDGPLYRSVLGVAFEDLPESLQNLHQPGARAKWVGRAEVQRGRNPLAGIAAAVFGFPNSGQVVPVTVEFTTNDDGTETWTRSFVDRQMTSHQFAGKGRDTHLLMERFGPFVFGLALDLRDGRLHLIPRQWRLGPLPLPRWLLPQGDSYEAEEDGRFRFHVEIGLPVLGQIVTYRGWLEPA